MFQQKRHIAKLCLLGASLALSACGSGAKHSSTASSLHNSPAGATQAATTTSTTPPPGKVPPQTVIARVAGKPIRFVSVARLMAQSSASQPPPVPPDYRACIAAEKAAPQGAGQSEAQLKQGCQSRYERLLSPAVSKAIHTQWLLGQAAEEGLRVSPEALQRELEQAKKSFKTAAEFEANLKSSGLTLADAVAEVKLNQLADQIFTGIIAHEHPATSAQVASYYASHPEQFSTPQGRDVRIVRTTTKAAALNAVKQLKAGKSFAEVAKQLSQIGQPIGAKEGEVKDLLPGIYEEKVLNDAIFNAKANQLSGPLELTAQHKTIAPETNSGFFIFEVVGSVPGKQTPLSKVKDSIAQSLTETQNKQVLASYIASFRRRWTARTDCQAGYVVRNCKQYAGPDRGTADPYTL